MQKFVDNGTVRRLLVTAVAMGAVLLNKKLGLEIDTDQQDLVVYLAMTYLLGSNGKEALLARAQKAGDEAAAKVEDPKGVLERAAASEKQKEGDK
jgi:hypothetical protein